MSFVHALHIRWLAALLGLTLVLLTLAAQVPRNASFDVGFEEGYGSDLPLVSGFYPAEPYDQTSPINWRWTTEQANVYLLGIGSRAAIVALRVHSVNEEVWQNGTQSFEVWASGRRIGTFPVIPQGSTFTFVLPPANSLPDTQGFQIRSATFSPAGDARSIGLPVDRVSYTLTPGPALPPIESTLGWLLAGVLGWLALRLAGWVPRTSFVLLALFVVLLAIAAVLDPPRTALGWWPAVQAMVFGILLVAVLRLLAPRFARGLAIPLDDRVLGWLLALAFVAFALRYGGKIYPFSMWGDIGFHSNRFLEVIDGRVLLLSRNRGVDFPYPPALYLLLAPLLLLNIDLRNLLHLAGAVFDALSVFLVYTIAVLTFRGPGQQTADGNVRMADAGWAVAAAALYSSTAATFMTTWWNFSTHIFAQFAHLLLIAALVVLVPHLLAPHEAQSSQPRWANARARTALALFTLAAVVYLGHFGFWINMSLLGGFAGVVLLMATQREKTHWITFWLLAAVFVAAELIAVAGFYSAYSGMFIEQAQAAQAGGLTGVAGRAPAPRDVLWRALWDAGFRVHFGFFPVPLALIGVGMWGVNIWRQRARPTTINSAMPTVLTLALGTLLVAAGFAALPFITGSTLSTRWLMFSAWLVAVAAIAVVRATWHRGWPVRVVYVLMAGYVLWVTASQWLGALAWRIRPPEPF